MSDCAPWLSIQLLLPMVEAAAWFDDMAPLAQTRRELANRFSGLSAGHHSRAALPIEMPDEEDL